MPSGASAHHLPEQAAAFAYADLHTHVQHQTEPILVFYGSRGCENIRAHLVGAMSALKTFCYPLDRSTIAMMPKDDMTTLSC